MRRYELNDITIKLVDVAEMARSKAQRWLTDHGSKVSHPTLESARVHAGDLNVRVKGRESKPWEPYACRWGDSPESPAETERHYHVGRVGHWTRKGVAKP